MSHFAVLVITQQEPTDDVLSAVLQPFHEYECTGIDDQYVVDIDVTQEVEDTYAKYTYRRWVEASGVKHDPYDDRFYRDPTAAETKEIGPIAGTGGSGELSWSSRDWGDGKGYRTRVHMTAEEAGMTEVTVPASEVESIEAWAKDYGGWERREDGRFVKHTNPNAQWDWWTVGGRYQGRLYAKSGATTQVGPRSGNFSIPLPRRDGVDIVRRGDLDFGAMKAAKETERREWIAEIKSKAPDLSDADLEIAIHADTALHEKWLTLPEPRPRGAEYREWQASQGPDGELAAKVSSAWFFDKPNLKPGQTIAEWIVAVPAITSWAVLMDGQWTEKGSMGWWGMSSDNKDDDEWQATVSQIVESLSPDQWLSVVDCHI